MQQGSRFAFGALWVTCQKRRRHPLDERIVSKAIGKWLIVALSSGHLDVNEMIRDNGEVEKLEVIGDRTHLRVRQGGGNLLSQISIRIDIVAPGSVPTS